MLRRALLMVSRQGERFVGAISSMKARAPVVGGNFGVWGGMFSTFDCAVKGFRKKEDAWNAIISGFMTGGCLALRSGFYWVCSWRSLHAVLGGPRGAFQSAVACGILLGVFEGVGVLLGRVFSEGQRPQAAPCEYIPLTQCKPEFCCSTGFNDPATVPSFIYSRITIEFVFVSLPSLIYFCTPKFQSMMS
jgi:hypothetical protein